MHPQTPDRPPQRRRLTAILGLLLVLSALSLSLVVGTFFSRDEPSGLHIHFHSVSWKSVTVESTNLSQPLHFTPATPNTSELLITPIMHGVYRIGIQLHDGRTVWSAYLHHDAGARKRVDLILSPSAQPGYIHFHQTANQKDELFTGDTRPEDATTESPFQLNWI